MIDERLIEECPQQDIRRDRRNCSRSAERMSAAALFFRVDDGQTILR